MLFFPNRKLAREFAARSERYKVVDNGTSAKNRWGVKFL